MTYEVWYVSTDWMLPSGTKTFKRYQDAKRYAKELSKMPNSLAVWIEGYEKIKDEDLDF